MKSIGILFPIYGIYPVGGLKVGFEYANRLIIDGYDVHIFYPMNVDTNRVSGFRLLKRILGFIYFKITKKYQPNDWFSLDKRIHQHLVWNLKENNTKGCQYYIATGIQTVFELQKYSMIDISKSLYLIQGFEDWVYPKEKVFESYKINIKKICIAPWLFDYVHKYDENVALIPNGFNTNSFFIEVPIDKKNRFEVATIYHNDDVKRCVDAITALKLVKDEIPELHVSMFGVPPKPDNLPDFITYYHSPNQELLRNIYNNAAIYVAASRSEGMALPPAEAMLCGSALICTDIGGFALYAINNKTALINHVFDVKTMADNIKLLILNDELRIKIAKDGNNFVSQFTWDIAYSKFKNILEQNG